MAKHISYSHKYDKNMRNYIVKKYRGHLKNQHQEIGQEKRKQDEFFKILTYFGETGRASYHVGYHINLNDNTNENFVNGLALEVNWDGHKSKTMPIKMKNMIDYEFKNEYPKQLKMQYFKLKEKLSNAVSYLNKNLRKISHQTKDKTNVLFSNQIKLRHLDMDAFGHHLNHSQSFAFIQESLMEHNMDYLVNEINVLFWKQTKVNDKYIYVNVWKIQQDTKQPNIKVFYGSIDCCNICTKQSSFQKHKCQWNRRNGFVAKVLVPQNSKL